MPTYEMAGHNISLTPDQVEKLYLSDFITVPGVALLVAAKISDQLRQISTEDLMAELPDPWRKLSARWGIHRTRAAALWYFINRRVDTNLDYFQTVEPSGGVVCHVCDAPHEGQPATKLWSERQILRNAETVCHECGWPSFSDPTDSSR